MYKNILYNTDKYKKIKSEEMKERIKNKQFSLS